MSNGTLPAKAPPAGTPSQGLAFGIRTPPQSRLRSAWLPGRRVADPSTMFGPYIDVLEDLDFSLSKDPKAYDKMMRDCQIRSCIRLRQLTTASRKLEFIPREDTGQAGIAAAKFAAKQWNKVRRPTEVLLNILDAIPRGSSFNEVVWVPNKEDFTWYSQDIVPAHKDRFIFTLDGELAIRTPFDVFYGQTVPPRTFIQHRYDPEPPSFDHPEAESRLYFGVGEFDRIYPWFQWKLIVLRLGFCFADRLAFPIKVGRYPYRDPNARSEIENVLQRLDHHRAVTWPSGEGWELDLIQSQATGHNVAMEWVSYIDTQIAKAILGSTLMQEPGERGSFALGAVHSQRVFGSLSEHDSTSLCDTLENTWVKWLFEINNIPGTLTPKVQQATGKETDIATVVDMMLLLAEKGFPISVEHVSDLTGIRPARQGETLLTMDMMSGGMGMDHGPGAPFGEAKTLGDFPRLSGSVGESKPNVYALGDLPEKHESDPDRIVAGYRIKIENPAGTWRYGVGENGKEWRTQFFYDYGYIVNTEGEDGEGVDVYVGPLEDPSQVFVVSQKNPKTGEFDEHKVMIGFSDREEASAAYFKHYDDPKYFGSIKSVPIGRFKKWIKENAKVKGKYWGKLKNLLVDLSPEQSVLEDDIESHAKIGLYKKATVEKIRRKIGPRKFKTVQRSSSEFRKIKFDYVNLKGEGSSFDVEPYSYRIRRGKIYLYAFDPKDRHIKSFFVHKLRNITVGGKFRPKWAIELAA